MEDQARSEKQELIDEVVGFNFRKLWFTFKELTFRPGETVAAFCDGFRARYVSPVTYFLLAYGINFYFTKASGLLDYSYNVGQPQSDRTSSRGMVDVFMDSFKAGNPSGTEAEFHNKKILFTSAFDFLSTKEGLLLISFPIIIFVQWFFFKKFRKPFLHHLYFLLFVSAQIDLLTVPLMIPFVFMQTSFWFVMVSTTILSVVIFVYAELKFYPKITLGNIVMRTIGQFAVSLIPFLIWFYLVLLVVMLIINKTFSPLGSLLTGATPIVAEHGISYEIGFKLGSFIAKFWPFVLVCVVAAIVLIVVRRKRSKSK